MGGGKKKRPISSADKRRKKVAEPKKSEKQEKAVAFHEVNDILLRRAARAVKDLDIVTPYTLANALNIRLSLARKVIRIMAEEGTLKIVDGSGPTIIAVASGK